MSSMPSALKLPPGLQLYTLKNLARTLAPLAIVVALARAAHSFAGVAIPWPLVATIALLSVPGTYAAGITYRGWTKPRRAARSRSGPLGSPPQPPPVRTKHMLPAIATALGGAACLSGYRDVVQCPPRFSLRQAARPTHVGRLAHRRAPAEVRGGLLGPRWARPPPGAPAAAVRTPSACRVWGSEGAPPTGPSRYLTPQAPGVFTPVPARTLVDQITSERVAQAHKLDELKNQRSSGRSGRERRHPFSSRSPGLSAPAARSCPPASGDRRRGGRSMIRPELGRSAKRSYMPRLLP